MKNLAADKIKHKGNEAQGGANGGGDKRDAAGEETKPGN